MSSCMSRFEGIWSKLGRLAAGSCAALLLAAGAACADDNNADDLKAQIGRASCRERVYVLV